MVIDIGICSFNAVSKTKSPGGFCVLRALLLVAISFPPKKTTKNTQKLYLEKTSRRFSAGQAGGGWLRQHLVGRHGVSDVFDVFYEPQRSGRRFFRKFQDSVFVKHRQIEAFGMDPFSK